MFWYLKVMTLEDVEKIMEDTREAVEYQQVSFCMLAMQSSGVTHLGQQK